MDNNTLRRYIEGMSSQEEKEKVVQWLDTDEKNMRDFIILRNVYDALLWNGERETTGIKTTGEKKKIRFVYECLKIAAVFLIALGCYHVLFPEKQSTQETPVFMQTVYAPEGQRTEITLADGTKVWLNAKTSLTFPNRFSETERKVLLNGEAYFEVRHDESKAFIVAAQEYQVKVLGTEFNVKAYQQTDYFETALVKGSVEVSSYKTGEKIVLTPHHLVYTEKGRLKQVHLPNGDPFLWKEGIIAFENEYVGDILKKMQFYYDVRIEVRNKTLSGDQYTGKFRTKDGIEHVLKVLQLRHKFKYVKDEDSDTIIIY
ncbi:MAG: FecR domain-containing protein [Tannerellaceae bacterium]|jgi:ferric-dicitrate binding protein FerR (iron transport regulator)|nr:FecR domain-containing protein [Tannerellaceae bacterium]